MLETGLSVGIGFTVTFAVVVATQPPGLVVTVSDATYVPDAEYVLVGDMVVDVLPSPKAQL
jgi:hypothetical protein